MIARRAVAALLALAATLALSPGAFAVDRSLGRDAVKPVAAGAPWSSTSIARLTRELDGMLEAAPTLHGAHAGLLVLETRSGNVLYARNADDAFQPASTLKLLTGSVALAALGADYRFTTRALFDAVSSTLYLEPQGDPLLTAADLDAMASSVRSAGISALRMLHVDAGAFDREPYPAGWAWDDLSADYAPPRSAATVEENLIHLSVRAGFAAGSPVVVSAFPVPLESVDRAIDNCRTAARFGIVVTAVTAQAGTQPDLDVERTAGGCVELVGSLPVGAEPQTVDAPVFDAPAYFTLVAQRALGQAGVTHVRERRVRDPSDRGSTEDATSIPAGARSIWTHSGEPLSDILADLWWPSDNLIAELLLEAIGRQSTGGQGTAERGAAAERAWLRGAGIDPATVTIADGSGLSAYDRVTPRALAAILQADWNGPYRDLVLDDLPLAGVRGTLARSFTGSLAERRTFAKTGTVNHTRGLAGYLATLHHGAVTFAWSVDDWQGTDADLAALRERVLSRLIGD